MIEAPPAVERASAAAFWANLHGILSALPRRPLAPAPRVAFEYRFAEGTLGVALFVPDSVPPGVVERAVEAAWPAARATATAIDAPCPLPPGRAVSGARFRVAGPAWRSLRVDHDADPLRAVVGAGATAAPGAATVVQVVARPARRRSGARLARQAAQGGWGRSGSPRGRPPVVARGTRQDGDWRAATEKAQDLLWRGEVRAVVAGPAGGRRERAELKARRRGLVGALTLFADARWLTACRLRRPRHVLAARRLGRGHLLSTPELAALGHLPEDTAVTGLARARAKALPPPPGVAEDLGAGKLLGDADAGAGRPVVVRTEDARQHLHVIGATGSGKSTLLVNLALQDVAAGRGVVVVDPKGDLVTDLLARLSPADRVRAQVLDPEREGKPPTLNVLEVPEGVDGDLVVDQLVGIFSRIFTAHWGPRTDDVMRSACKTLVKRQPATLVDVPVILTDDEARSKRTAALDEDDDPGLTSFWRWYEHQSEGHRAQVIGSTLNKLRAFLLRDFVRDVVDAPQSSVDMTQILDGRILLVRVPKGVLGDDTARLLGSFVTARVWQAATGRSRLVEDERKDAALYVDECQNFLTLPRSFDEILAEARGYRLSLVLAHQHLGQLPRALGEAISASARNKVFFNLSPEDASALAHHVAPELSAHDLSHLGRYQAACRLVADGSERPAFTITTRPTAENPPTDRATDRATDTPTDSPTVHRPSGSNTENPPVRAAPTPTVQPPDSKGEIT